MTAFVLALQLLSAPGVLLYSVDADNVDARRKSLLHGSLRLELEKLDGIALVDFREAVISQPSVQDCDVKPPAGKECLARFAQAFSSEEVVTARASYVGGLSVLLLKRLRLADGEIVASVTRNLSRGEGEEFLLALGGAVAELYADKPLKTSSTRGVDLAVAQRWTPNPISIWVFGSAAAVSVGLLGGATYAGFLAMQSQDDYNALARKSQTQPVAGRDLVRLEREATSRANLTTGLLVGGLATAGITALLGVFTDWDSDPEWVAAQ